MRGVSYLGLVEYQDKKFHKFFSSSRARIDSPKALAACEEWTSEILRAHGTVAVRASLSKVLWSISG